MVTISQEKLNQMMSSSPILSLEERQALKKQNEERQQAARAKANLRKQRMLEVYTPESNSSQCSPSWHLLQMEAERRKHQPKTESEIVKDENDKGMEP